MLPTKYKLFLSIYLSHSNINGFIAVFFSVAISFESIIHLKTVHLNPSQEKTEVLLDHFPLED